MSVLYVIRHGQASFGAADYDNLTPHGVEQARMLGRFFAADGRKLDLAFSGPRRRQIDTARHFRGEHPSPDAEIVPGFDEFDAEVIVRQASVKLLADGDPDARAAFGDDASSPPRDGRGFQRLFERIIVGWARGELAADGAESFHVFAARVRAAFKRVMVDAGRGKTVAVFTSAGPVSIAMQLCLGLSDEKAMRLSWIVANGSVTELRFREDELSLVAFNALPHAPARTWVTYR